MQSNEENESTSNYIEKLKDNFIFKTPNMENQPSFFCNDVQTEKCFTSDEIHNELVMKKIKKSSSWRSSRCRSSINDVRHRLKFPNIFNMKMSIPNSLVKCSSPSSTGGKIDFSSRYQRFSRKLLKKNILTSKKLQSIITPVNGDDATGTITKTVTRTVTRTSKTTTSPSIGQMFSSNLTSNNIRQKDSLLIVALVEGRGVAFGEIGMVSLDLKHPELELSQFSDSIGYSRTLLKLYVKDPVEIVFPHTMCENGVRSKLFQIVSEYLHHASITTINRRYFNDINGEKLLRNLCHHEYTSAFYEIREKYYALSACAALIKYVEFIQNMVFVPFSLKVTFSGSVKCMMLDISSVKNLELVENSTDFSINGSLFHALNFTSTTGGSRQLRANILQPSFDIPTIVSRHDCVAELISNPELFFALKSQIGHFVSINHLLSLCVQLPKQHTVKSAENTITQVIALKHIMELIPTLRATLHKFKSSVFSEYYSLLIDSRYDTILAMINVVIHEEVHFEKGILQMRTQKLFAVKDGINVILDIARKSYSEQIESLREEVKSLSEEYQLPFRVAFNNSQGFFIQMSLSGMTTTPQLSDPFIKVMTVKNVLSCTTETIMKLNERLKGALSEIYLTAELVLSELIEGIRAHMGVLYRLCEITSTLDLFLSFAQLSHMQNYVRPEFTDVLALKNCRNPLHDRLSTQETVANHVFCSSQANFTVVTGVNMSGKSIYLRKIALVQIMAQIGCFIPAEYASLRLTDHLFTRIGVDDDIQSNSSTFTIEMREMSYIINCLSDHSLVIIDELGRGTSFDEGLGISFAFCEHLLQTKAFIFIATHFIELTKLENLYPNVQNIFFEVRNISESEDVNKLYYTYRCKRGPCPYNTNGLRLARLSNLPEQLLSEAETIYAGITDKRELTIEDEVCGVEDKYNLVKLSQKVKRLSREVQLITPDLKQYLMALRSHCIEVLDKCSC